MIKVENITIWCSYYRLSRIWERALILKIYNTQFRDGFLWKDF